MFYAGSLTLSDWAKREGIRYLTAWRWWKEGRLPPTGSRPADTFGEHGVRFDWAVDPEEETVPVFALEEGGYGEPRPLRPGQILSCPLFPGVDADAGDLFA